MPEENRSSNTELISQAASAIEDLLANGTGAIAAGAWASLPAELRELATTSAPQLHPEPIAWMVGTAFWWTKEEAERDAAEMSLPVIGLGPMTNSAQVERLRAALKFYADRDHFAEDIGSDWDSVSGEPANILWHEHEAWFVEDGSIARAALLEISEHGLRLKVADPSATSNQAGNEG